MKQQLQKISESQKASWNKFSRGWKKWEQKLYDHMQPTSDGMINLLKPEGSQIILDIAGGTGEPGLSIAQMLNEGKVIITDLSDEMLNIARENASKKGITNVEFKACDVSELPFPDNTFDAVSCRMGFMFFPDMLLAAKEIRRVLKPGGKFATAVWGSSDKNFWGTAIGNTINKNMNLPNPSPDAPGIFRCGKSGLMIDIFNQAGFNNSSETEVICKLNCETAEIYWELMTEIAAPIVASMENADEAMKAKIKKEVCELINEKYPAGNVVIDGIALLIYGEK
ncbi:methyltransferase domain-containing protein [Kaistella flava (ex Peng et al. 2021)]|uniref:Methyltransferase domain-containing protein n=1 Tax=Kaistella flava (ex Peng et al. 2021) TaxID=2038776 RepID=A0A7M2Y4U2_9FLAO|nr:methyltransferase domain-containing protein [Kaistella flava (ex Peng et al. 2021)]QOW08869.1 methyltransferase domain-containing protein [Kaistella flava (ex Peng et al. 2021)]